MMKNRNNITDEKSADHPGVRGVGAPGQDEDEPGAARPVLGVRIPRQRAHPELRALKAVEEGRGQKGVDQAER